MSTANSCLSIPADQRFRFLAALHFTLKEEGGYVNHPADPGGATNKGITQKVYDAWRKGKHLGLQAVALIQQSEVEEIYYRKYWLVAGCDRITDWRLAVAVFDFAVNSGPSRAVKTLQQSLPEPVRPSSQDGIFGPITYRAVAATVALGSHVAERFTVRYIRRREMFLKGLKTWRVFGRGWSARINRLINYVTEAENSPHAGPCL